MRKAAAFSIAAGVVVLLLVALVLVEVRRPTGWQDELIGHLARLGARGDEVRLLSIKRAARPDLFDGSLSRALQGNQSYNANLPYPPDVLYCIHLEHHDRGLAARRQLVFLARHHDLHSADWILHEGDYEPFDDDLAGVLKSLGCVAVLDV
jgi:hypothetical protein